MFKIRSYVAWQIYDNILYIFDDKNRETYTLDGTGLLVWKYIAAGLTYDEILKAVSENYIIEVELIKQDIDDFIDELKNSNLIEVMV
jgi:hypothetical protein